MQAYPRRIFTGQFQSLKGTSKDFRSFMEMRMAMLISISHTLPSKVKATVEAIASRYPGRDIVACLELHTYSSLNINFLPSITGRWKCIFSIRYFNPHSVKIKKLPSLSVEEVRKAFGKKDIMVFDNSSEMFSYIRKTKIQESCLTFFMSSGDFDGMNLLELSEEIAANK